LLAIQCFNEILNKHYLSGNVYIPFLPQVRKWKGGGGVPTDLGLLGVFFLQDPLKPLTPGTENNSIQWSRRNLGLSSAGLEPGKMNGKQTQSLVPNCAFIALYFWTGRDQFSKSYILVLYFLNNGQQIIDKVFKWSTML